VRSYVAYSWDQEEIRSRLLWRERSLRWDDITAFDVRDACGQLTYVLTDVFGRRLNLDIHALGTNHPLHAVLKQKLAPLADGGVIEAGRALRTEFPIRLLRVTFGTIILRDNTIIAKGVFRTQKRSVSQLREARQSTRCQYGSRDESAAFVFRDGTVIGVPHITTGYHALLESVRSRAPNAVWFQTRGPEPQDKPAKIVYWRYRVESLRERMKTLWLADVALLSVVGWVIWKIARRGWQIPPELESELRWTWPILALPFALSILAYAKYPRRLRTLRQRLAAAEAEEETAKQDETNSQLTEED
jgi:hypothetical protein